MIAPTSPTEAERLWHDAEPLARETLPEWLDPEEADAYRLLGRATRAERDAFERAWCVVEEDGRVYIPRPAGDPVFAIAVLDAESPLRLPDEIEPTLTRDDVPGAAYVADPFLAGGHLFYELFHWQENKGVIAVEDGGVVLEEEFHLSYPCVFAHDGEWYMLPETHQAGDVRLYRAREFPGGWEPVATLLTGTYFDATPFFHDRRWWLLAAAEADLRLFSAEEPTGPWREHPAGPIVDGDPGRARPAGRPLQLGGRLVRLAQDCSTAYGAAVRAFEVTTLDPDRYEERELPESPLLAAGEGWRSGGMHHLDAERTAGGWRVAVDGWRQPTGAGGSDEPPICPVCGVTMVPAELSAFDAKGDWVCLECEETALDQTAST